MRRARASLVLLLAAALTGACVPGVEVEGAPCPCPGGYVCCAALDDTCLPDGAACPERLPASTATPCRRDVECGRGEVCHSWTLASGTHAGPGECRHACEGAVPCAAGEDCAPALHDGAVLDPTNATRACLPDPLPPVCAALGCAACGPDRVGRTWCGEDGVQGCFLAVHPECGLVCHAVLLAECPAPACEEGADGARCAVFGGDPCGEHPCAGCPDGAAPGEPACAGATVVVCATLAARDELCGGACACDRWCAPVPVETCPAGCDPATARCAGAP